jgi:HD-GYP domain-containing protein (c-di-GMP phosphodiesterase class II)
MSELRRSAQIYIALLVAAALALLGALLGQINSLNLRDATLALTLAGLMTAAHLCPIQFSYRTKLTLDTAVIFASVLLFQPGLAMLVVGGGTLLAHALQRQPLVDSAFNTAQTLLQAGVGGLLLLAAGWEFGAVQLDHATLIVTVVIVGAVVYLVNTLAVATIVGLQVGLPPHMVWRQSVGFDAVEELAQLALGLLAAAMIDTHVWTLPLLLLPALAVYLSLQRQTGLRQQTLDAVESLADVVDLRDPYTADHSRRVAAYARELAAELDLSPREVQAVEMAARVHDVGKIVVDQVVLGKTGPLSDREWQQLRSHPATGARILGRFPQFVLATSYVRHHHERIDGCGYPDGLSGEQIPLGARIIAVADALDAMVSARPYRPALSIEQVMAELAANQGSQWDVRVVDELVRLVESGRIAVPGAEQYPAGVFPRLRELVREQVSA